MHMFKTFMNKNKRVSLKESCSKSFRPNQMSQNIVKSYHERKKNECQETKTKAESKPLTMKAVLE